MHTDRLRTLREAHSLTQEELAIYLGISEPQVWRYEKGENQPRADILVKLSGYFNVSVDYLLGISDDPRIHIDGDLSQEEHAVISALRHGEAMEAIKIIVASH